MKFVESWNGFEDLIAEINSTGTVEIKKNVKLKGNSGAIRQIDILLLQKHGFYENKILIECKYWNKKVTRLHVDSMAYAIQDLKASKGVFFTTRGYQKGAKIVADFVGIDLFVVRELSNLEWGLPGKEIYFFIQYYSKTIEKVDFEYAGNYCDLSNSIKIGETQTPVDHKLTSLKSNTIEGLIEESTTNALKQIVENNNFRTNNDTDGSFYFSEKINIDFKETAILKFKGFEYCLLGIYFEMGIKMDQQKFYFDRSKKYSHIFMVENCINNSLYYTSKEKEDDFSDIKSVKPINETKINYDDVLENGSVLKIILNNWFDPKKLHGLKRVTRES